MSELSGGNQQKVVLAKWLEISPTVVLLDDPTRGVDVGAKHEIYALVRQLADSGRIVVLRSTELPEIVGLADRILVFYRGRLATECRAADVDTSRCCTPSTPGRCRDGDRWVVMTVPLRTMVAGRCVLDASERAPASERPARPAWPGNAIERRPPP